MSALDPLLHRAESAAADWDDSGLPRDVVTAAASAGVLAMDRAVEHGSAGADARETGRVAAELGAVCSSLRSLFTVQGMVAATVDRWVRGSSARGGCPSSPRAARSPHWPPPRPARAATCRAWRHGSPVPGSGDR